MRKLFTLSLVIFLIIAGCGGEKSERFIHIKGGPFVNTQSNLHGKDVFVNDFYMDKYEVTQKEWKDVMGSNPSKFKGDNLPVETVSWYDCVEYCNKRSVKEGLNPYYNIDKNKKDPNNKNNLDSIKWIVTINEASDGYRLPTEVEWEYAASGGQKSQGYTFSGSDDINQVAWYWRNSGDEILSGDWLWTSIENNNCRPKPVGLKEPNELGLYDMSGNVREWCEEWYQDSETNIGFVRVQRGGGWIGGELRCQINNRHHFDANGKGPDQGLRLCRSKITQ